MYDTVVFDLDGTLLNTLDDLYEAVNNAMLICSYPIKTKDEVRLAVGNGAANLIRRCMPKGEDARFSECLFIFKAEYSKCKTRRTAPYDTVIKTLSALKMRGVKVAVVSNKPESAVIDLCEKWFSGLVDIAVGDNGVRPIKPSPEAIEYALNSLGSSKESSVYVGDQEVDVLSAKNAGVRLLAAGWGFRGEETMRACGAETVLSSPWEVLKFFPKKED